MPNAKYPSIEYVRQCLEYQDGKLYWLDRPMEHFSCQMVFTRWGTRYAGREAGCKGMFGSRSCHLPRVIVTIDKVRIYRAVIVWALRNDRWPDHEIDHKDGDSLNDRIENLREATIFENKANQKLRKDNSSGLKGIDWREDKGKYRVRVGGIHVGYFDTEEEAKEARYERGRELYGDFYRTD